MKNQIDNKVQIEDKTVSHSYDMEAVEFLDHINFDTPDFEDDEIDYIEEYIYWCQVSKDRGASYLLKTVPKLHPT